MPIVPNDFRGLLSAPSYEQEVVLLFGLLLPHLDEPLIIDECRESFPDCIAIRSGTGSKIRIEFELKSSNFHAHEHPETGCDMIVCWEHDWASCPQNIEVVELKRLLTDRGLKFVLDPINSKYTSTTWTKEKFFNAAGQNPVWYLHELYDFCSAPQSGLTVLPGHGSKQASFTIKTTAPGSPRRAILGIYADGGIWVGLTGLPEPIRNQYRKRLSKISGNVTSNEAKEWFNFTITNKAELDVVKSTLQWLAAISW